MLFAPLCLACRGPAAATRPRLCSPCRLEVDRARLPAEVEPPPGVDLALALFRYQPTVRRLVLAAKNGGQRPLLDQWGRDLAEHYLEVVGPAVGAAPVDVVTWLPASRSGVRARGYDQGRALARPLGRSLGVSCRRMLVRRPGPAQTGRDRRSRSAGPDLRAAVEAPARVLIVDDVLTTGASLRTAARALRTAGAASVSAVVVAAVGDHPLRPGTASRGAPPVATIY